MQNSSYKLRWLNGLLAGREFMLPEGELRMGGPDADLALVLEANAQAQLTIDGSGVTVTPGPRVWVDGEPWTDDGPLPMGPVIDVAGQAFVLGHAEDTLPMRPVPQRSCRDTARTAAAQGAAAFAMPAVTAITASRTPWAVPMGGISALLVALAIAGALWRPGPPPEQFDAKAWLSAQLKQASLADVRVREDAVGAFVLSGRCAAAADIDRLRQRLHDAQLLVRDETICADTVRQAVRQVLAANGYDDVLVVDGTSADTVTIRGDIEGDRRWERTAEQLIAVRGLRGWTIVNDSASAFDDLIARLEKRGLLEGIAVTKSSRTLWVTARVSAPEERALRAVVDEYNAQKGASDLPAQLQRMAAGTTSAEALPAPIVGVGGNTGSIYVELANGMRVQKGAVLPSGYTVYALNRSWVTLRKAQRLISLRLDF